MGPETGRSWTGRWRLAFFATALAALGFLMVPAEQASAGDGESPPQVRTAKPRAPNNSRASTPKSSAPKPNSATRTRPSGGSNNHATPRGNSGRRGHSSSHRTGHHGGHRSFFGSFYYGYRHYYPYYGYHHYGYYPRYYPRYYPYSSRGRYGDSGYSGALDLNVYPRKVDVFLNGQPIGRAGRFDGFPGHLWLDEGKYELIFYRDGFETEVREVRVVAGVKVDINVEMVPGQARPVSELSSPPPWPRPRTTEASYRKGSTYSRPQPQPGAGSEGAGSPQSEDSRDMRGEPARLYLSVTPSDASVYLDGRFLGTGSELAALRAGLIVDPGSHQLSVVRPGRKSEEVDFRVEAGEDIELEVSLGAENV